MDCAPEHNPKGFNIKQNPLEAAGFFIASRPSTVPAQKS
jgi:hypothetical protein